LANLKAERVGKAPASGLDEMVTPTLHAGYAEGVFLSGEAIMRVLVLID
jgi:hypothetical protein